MVLDQVIGFCLFIYKHSSFIATTSYPSSTVGGYLLKMKVGSFKTPILFYSLSETFLLSTQIKNFQHTFIIQSLGECLQLNIEYLTRVRFYLSKNELFSLFSGGFCKLVKGDFYLVFASKKSLGLFNWKLDIILQQNLTGSKPLKLIELEKFVKADILSYISKVRNNDMIIKH